MAMSLPIRTSYSLISFLHAGAAWSGVIALGKEGRRQIAQRTIVRVFEHLHARAR